MCYSLFRYVTDLSYLDVTVYFEKLHDKFNSFRCILVFFNLFQYVCIFYFQERVVSYCQRMSGKQWLSMDHGFASGLPDLHGLTLLHLAAMLGYSRYLYVL